MFINSRNNEFDRKKSVVVSVLPLKYFVDQIANGKIDCYVMVPPGSSPAMYEPTSEKMRQVADASLFFSIGVPAERMWLSKIAQMNRDLKIINLTDGIQLRSFDNRLDPHIWNAPSLVEKIAEKIYISLSETDPENKSYYHSNYLGFVEKVKALDQAIREKMKGKKKRVFMVYHPAWGYFAREYGLKQIAIETEGKEPSPRQLDDLIRMAKQYDIKVIFVQKQFSKKSAEAIALAVGADVVVLDPLSENYFENMMYVADEIAKSL